MMEGIEQSPSATKGRPAMNPNFQPVPAAAPDARIPHSRQSAYAAFCATVFACVAAAAAVASNDLPLMLGGF